MLMGYLVKFKRCASLFAPYGDVQKVICSKERLSKLLVEVNCYVLSAQVINVKQYQQNHEEQPEVWE